MKISLSDLEQVETPLECTELLIYGDESSSLIFQCIQHILQNIIKLSIVNVNLDEIDTSNLPNLTHLKIIEKGHQPVFIKTPESLISLDIYATMGIIIYLAMPSTKLVNLSLHGILYQKDMIKSICSLAQLKSIDLEIMTVEEEIKFPSSIESIKLKIIEPQSPISYKSSCTVYIPRSLTHFDFNYLPQSPNKKNIKIKTI